MVRLSLSFSVEMMLTLLVARNLKYYPLSLKLAMGENGALSFIASTFKIKLCGSNETKNFYSCLDWELLNLEPSVIADIPDQLFKEYNISSDALSNALEPHSIQTLGMEELNKRFGITSPGQYMVSIANHYSWPKGCAITGIGKDNLKQIGVDQDIRMDIDELESALNDCVTHKQHVFCVVVVCGERANYLVRFFPRF